MKPHLLLYLTSETNPSRNAIAATLSWACEEAGWYFEVYYDGYRLGEHYGGGDPDTLPAGYAAGGTLVGAHHHERLYLLLHRFDTTVLLDGPVAFGPALAQLDTTVIAPRQVPRAAYGESLAGQLHAHPPDLYRMAFDVLGVPFPDTLAILDVRPTPILAGLDAYYYPDVVAHRAAAFIEGGTTSTELAAIAAEWGMRSAALLGLNATRACEVERSLSAAAPGILITCVDVVLPTDSFDSVTERLARRHLTSWRGGWILADPMTVASWLPEAVRERRLALYGKPQHLVIQRLSVELSATQTAVFGRQYEDADFFALSSLGVAFQLIDPGRPPFPVLRHAGYHWRSDTRTSMVGKLAGEPDEQQLRRWMDEGRVLTSIVFWTGMIRELENLPRIMDLVALTRLKAGLALTTEALAYQPESPLELLRVPIEHGGVFPHLEMLLASCGVGAAIESRLPQGRLAAYLRDALAALDKLGMPPHLRPQGWWSTMDCEMLPLPRPRLPISVTSQRRAPFVKVRYAGSIGASITTRKADADPDPAIEIAPDARGPRNRSVGKAKRHLGDWARKHGLREVLAPYRPYEFFAPGPFPASIVPQLRTAGLSYMFSKAGFGAPARVLYHDDDFVALNYTVGHWDGWTPFETINGLQDLHAAERRLLARRQPGWLVGTLDTCLWAFTGPIWARGAELRSIGEFLERGGASGQLINVQPSVVARYARILARFSGADGAAK